MIVLICDTHELSLHPTVSFPATGWTLAGITIDLLYCTVAENKIIICFYPVEGYWKFLMGVGHGGSRFF